MPSGRHLRPDPLAGASQTNGPGSPDRSYLTRGRARASCGAEREDVRLSACGRVVERGGQGHPITFLISVAYAAYPVAFGWNPSVERKMLKSLIHGLELPMPAALLLHQIEHAARHIDRLQSIVALPAAKHPAEGPSSAAAAELLERDRAGLS